MVLSLDSVVALSNAFLLAQVIEGETSVINVRDTNSSLSSLVGALVVLGILAVVGTVVFGWFTRPKTDGAT